jgi:hypothetical protein
MRNSPKRKRAVTARCLNNPCPALCDTASKHPCTVPGGSTPAAWLRRSLLTILITGATGLPVYAYAIDAGSSRTRNTPAVIMMVGGLGDTDSPVSGSSSAGPGNPIALSDDSGRLSVVTQPGAAHSALSGLPPASVASRVMAFAPMVDEAARATDVDSALLMAVIDVESGGNPQAVSPKGATGLMQLMPATGKRHGVSNLLDPRQNIAAGARYLHQLMQQFGDLQLVLAAYNAGEGAVQKYGGQVPPYAETMSYVPKVMGRYMHYRNITSGLPARPKPQATQRGFLLVRQSDATDD